MLIDALSIYFGDATLASAFVAGGASWLTLRSLEGSSKCGDEPEPRIRRRLDRTR
jgi:hypothetical protein